MWLKLVGGKGGLARLSRHAISTEIHPMTNHELETEVLRRMTPEQKLAVMRSLIRQAYALKAAGIRALDPELSDQEVQLRARAAVGGDRP
jgi:hypothetical protein